MEEFTRIFEISQINDENSCTTQQIFFFRGQTKKIGKVTNCIYSTDINNLSWKLNQLLVDHFHHPDQLLLKFHFLHFFGVYENFHFKKISYNLTTKTWSAFIWNLLTTSSGNVMVYPIYSRYYLGMFIQIFFRWYNNFNIDNTVLYTFDGHNLRNVIQQRTFSLHTKKLKHMHTYIYKFIYTFRSIFFHTSYIHNNNLAYQYIFLGVDKSVKMKYVFFTDTFNLNGSKSSYIFLKKTLYTIVFSW